MKQELNINYLSDGDLVIYEDADVEFKHHSHLHNARMVPEHRLPYGISLPNMQYVVNKDSPNQIQCAVVKTSDEQYNYYNNIQGCTPYGYDNNPK
jgi:hypothetical protein